MAFEASSAPAPARFWSETRKRVYGVVAIVAIGLSIYTALGEWRESHSLFINETESLPNWAFVLDRQHLPARGQLILFKAPLTQLVVAHFGADPATFTKIAYGIGGDRVTRIGRTFYVNGRKVAVAKERSLRGEALALGPTGVIPRGCYFAATPHKDGFDSRYAAIGWPCSDRVVGTGSAIL